MYSEFSLKTDIEGIVGYEFPTDSPLCIMTVIHGIGEHMGRYDRMAGILNKDGIGLVGMDLRGHGKSPGKRGDCAPRQSILSDIDYLLQYTQEKYTGIPIVFYGHSMGGNIALDYRSRGKLNEVPSAYIISAPWLELVRKIPSPLYKIVKLLAGVEPSLTMGSSVDESILGHPDSVLPYLEDELVHTKISLGCAIDGFEIGKSLETGTHTDNGKGKNVPCLLMHGGEDRICSVVGSRKLAELEKDNNLTFIEWPGLYHEIHNGGPQSRGDEVIKKIDEFILSSYNFKNL